MSCTMPEIGSCISLVSKADIRYEGLLFTVDPDRCTIALARVKSFGTEDREAQFPIAPQNQCYDYILFRGSDIKDIRVINNCSVPNDPAIMQMHLPPPQANKMVQPNYQSQGFMMPQMTGPLTGPLTGPPPMSQFNNFGLNNLGGMSIDTVKNSFPGVNQNAIKTNEQNNILLSSEPPPQAEHKDQASVLDMIGGGSRSTTPSNVMSRKSPTADMAVQTNQSQNNSRENNNRSGDSGSARGGDQQRNKVNPIQRNSNQRERRDSGKTDNQIQTQQNHQNQPQQRQGNTQNRGWNNNRNYQNHNQNQNHSNNNNMRGRARGRGPPPQGTTRSKHLLKFDNDYDFEQANNKFEELRSQLSKLKVGDDVKTEQVTSETLEKKDDSGNETGAGEHEPDEEEVICYDKTKSFFDTISCEAVERSKGKSQRTDWRQERKLNSETFGVSSTRRGGFYFRFRGRGGYYNRGPNFRGNYNGNYRGSGSYRGRSAGTRNQISNGLPQRNQQQQQQPSQPQQPSVIAVAAGK